MDARIAVLAAAQDGVVERAQLFALGATEGEIRHRLRRRRLLIVHPRVYAVGHDRLTLRGRAISALLSGGADAVLSHLSAAAIWGLFDDDLSWPHVTVPRASRQRRTLEVHRCRLPDLHLTTRQMLPVTTVARTILDCAEINSPQVTAKLIREARVKELTEPEQLRSVMGESPGRHGIIALKRLLDQPESEPTRSNTERRLLRLLLDAGLPRPQVNAALAGRLRDLAWVQHRVVVEVDDYNTHGDERSFHADRARDAQLVAQGWLVLRFTRRQIRDHPFQVVAQIAAALAQRAA